MSKLNLQNPFQGRRWLRLLEEDPETGFLLRKSYSATKSELGFSFESNKLGLRGPSNTSASRVILGTSFAMGIAVDNGYNWYESALDETKWLNLGLPVGFEEWLALERRYHCGPKELAVLIYHPNLWIHCEMYRMWRESGRGVFSALNWHTSLSQCLRIYFRRLLHRQRSIQNGTWISFGHNNDQYQVDANYARIPDPDVYKIFERHVTSLASILSQYRNILAIRVPIKQEQVPDAFTTKPLASLVAQYDKLWQLTKAHFYNWPNIVFEHPQVFSLSHFHAQDSHWNIAGNREFANCFRKYLSSLPLAGPTSSE